jgi:hypothetical protein
MPELGRSDIGPIATRFDRRIDPLQLRLLRLANIVSLMFVQFDGEGDTANARPRALGGHPAVLLREYAFAKIRTARTRTTTVTFRLDSW